METPLLLSPAGAAITLLNWSGERLDRLGVRVQVPFTVRTIESAKHGAVPFQREEGGVTCALPLDAADILAVRP